MNSPFIGSSRGYPVGRSSQQGIVLIFTLICLVIMLISAIVIIRVSDTSQALTSNLGFKKDLVNQGERALQQIYTNFNTASALGNSSNRLANSATYNYSACILPADSRGIPLILEDSDSNFTSPPTADINTACAGSVANTAHDILDTVNGISLRYVIDRLCVDSNTPTTVNCITSSLGVDTGGSSGTQKTSQVPTAVYRISVRVKGPRNTLTYVQSTLTL